MNWLCRPNGVQLIQEAIHRIIVQFGTLHDGLRSSAAVDTGQHLLRDGGGGGVIM